jgi:hypothetical protein
MHDIINSISPYILLIMIVLAPLQLIESLNRLPKTFQECKQWRIWKFIRKELKKLRSRKRV